MGERQDQIVVFCCRHSSWRAAARGTREGLPLPPPVQLILVPCSGRVSMELILAALERGARGVMVLGCHPGACHHLYGGERARERVTAVQQRLQEAGLEPERVAFATLGPDSAADLVRIVTEFMEPLMGD
ncbi:hydrogenase iron-sulfur subunit [Moorella sp. Hama-1]|uniref:hydrogenase iron-sulfur subunit n=1 Tax=Moorella sp. Hama-1 TaxID=2138101 RepID=UPI000D648146|nr:hydrogenase iron-sulfur subunit [Moorella sp. Hama-1]MDN5362592.1 F420-non-reducing hydrogenase iron-sulfur subunit [Moorella sp. (in: firmicutes)]BCV20260.1 methyl-viologen-reducing hydrogenase subunit delta [Moorella sp. Hama-1]